MVYSATIIFLEALHAQPYRALCKPFIGPYIAICVYIQREREPYVVLYLQGPYLILHSLTGRDIYIYICVFSCILTWMGGFRPWRSTIWVDFDVESESEVGTFNSFIQTQDFRKTILYKFVKNPLLSLFIPLKGTCSRNIGREFRCVRDSLGVGAKRRSIGKTNRHLLLIAGHLKGALQGPRQGYVSSKKKPNMAL